MTKFFLFFIQFLTIKAQILDIYQKFEISKQSVKYMTNE